MFLSLIVYYPFAGSSESIFEKNMLYAVDIVMYLVDCEINNMGSEKKSKTKSDFGFSVVTHIPLPQ